MKLIKNTTENEQLAADMQELVDSAARSVHYAISKLNDAYEKMWSLDDADLVEYLNFLGPVVVNEILDSNTRNGTALNTILDEINDPLLSKRVALAPGREIEWDAENSTFVII